MSSSRVRVGIIGCGEVTQVVHLPNLVFLSEKFHVTYLCDVSPGALQLCSSRLPHPHKTTSDPNELCTASDVDVVFVVNSDEYHAEHSRLALFAGKHVFVEKPVALSCSAVNSIIDAEAETGNKVMVGYMRRYASAFEDALKEIGGAGEILYAKVRDIIAPNPVFISQSGTFPQRFTDVSEADKEALSQRAATHVHQGLAVEAEVAVSELGTDIWRILGSLGSHDLSLMREALGMPESVLGCNLQFPIWTVLFKYPTFAVTYESGFDEVPRFDAHIEIFGKKKTVKVIYDTPYVKGLPVTMVVRESVEGDEKAFQERTIRRTYEDPYTLEMLELWEMIVHNKPVKTTLADARKDLLLNKMIVQAAQKLGQL
ncbi:hypothetical protein BZA77DRAFT_49503 [Pyronema omphalodes]|nr:hypothetical protein BZA77DRAFT_49503 [Pyronema omphalodes]